VSFGTKEFCKGEQNNEEHSNTKDEFGAVSLRWIQLRFFLVFEIFFEFFEQCPLENNSLWWFLD